ncbi:MAG: NUDIX domain-containing protein [Pseudomonadota bacterium]
MVERHAVRALVLSPEGEILLAQMHLTDRSVWCTPGGGLEEGESPREGLLRELREEIGDRDWHITSEVWYCSHRFDFEGELYLQHERFYLVPTPIFEPPLSMNDPEEQQFFGEYRWWQAFEIKHSLDAFEPGDLHRLLRNLLRGVPTQPLHIGTADV